MSVDEIEDSVVGPADVLLRIEACGICGSDLTYLSRGVRRPNGDPWPLGHEAVGTVVGRGEKATQFALGMRVVINPMVERDNIIGNGGNQGAFADRLVIRAPVAGVHLHIIEESVSTELAALAEPLAVALHSLNVANLQPSERAVVLGVGPIGLGAVYWLAQRGAKDIVAVDRSIERLKRALALGARHLIDTRHTNLSEGLAACHGIGQPLFGRSTVGTDVFFDMAGAASLLDEILACGKSGSRIVMTAMYKDPVKLNLQAMLLREISLLPSVGYPEFADVFPALATADGLVNKYISHRFAFSDIDEAFATAASQNSSKVLVSFG